MVNGPRFDFGTSATLVGVVRGAVIAVEVMQMLAKTRDKLMDSPLRRHNVQRNRAATLRVDFRFRRIRRSGSRNCSVA